MKVEIASSTQDKQMLTIQNVHLGPRMSEICKGEIANALILGCDNLPKDMSSGEQRSGGGGKLPTLLKPSS